MRILFILAALLGVSVGYEDKTVVQYLQDNGFTVLSKLINDAGLASTLSASGPFTVLAPTDAAFSKVDLATMTSLANNPSQLKKVLEYHVIPEFVLAPQVNGNVTKTTVSGQDVLITGARGMPLLFNSNSRLNGTGDIICNNGVIQPIDTVLLPPVVDTMNIAEVLLTRDADFKDLFLAFMLSNLTSLIESSSGDFTLFAPIDTAFGSFRDGPYQPSGPNISAIWHEILKYHIIPGERPSTLLKDGPVYTLHGTPVTIIKSASSKYCDYPTLNGTPVTIIKSASSVKVNTANVIEADIGASNGVIHAIDKILIPPEFIPTQP